VIDGKRWRPLWLVLVVVVLVVFGWLPDGQLSDAERQNKPQLVVTYHNATSPAEVNALAEDIQSRLAPRHEWRLVANETALTWRLRLDFAQRGTQLEVTGQLYRPATDVALHRFKVEGETEVSANLADRVAQLSTEAIEAASPPR